MFGPKALLYFPVIGLIRTVKWVELQFLKVISKWIINKAIKIGREELGIIFHLDEDSYKNWGPKDEADILAKLAGKFGSLVHIRVHDSSFFVQLAHMGTLALGDGYVNGMWECCKGEGDIADLVYRLLQSNLKEEMFWNWLNRLLYYLEFKVFKMQTRSRAIKVVDKLYGLGNDAYEAMLDPNIQHSCGYWANSDNLTDAQLAKLELIGKKLKPKPGMRVLDIGCGWGMLCKYLVDHYQVECVGLTISKDGAEYARKVCKGLPVEIRIQDYREINESFDRIVSVGMFEHVGQNNHRTYFEAARRNLKDNGLFLCQTIGENDNNPFKYDRWRCAHTFPGVFLPSTRDITNATAGLLVIEDWHNFGLDYSKTLACWRTNFKKNWPDLKDKYGNRFYRMWSYYLAMWEGCFIARKFQLWQIVLSKEGLKEGYISCR